VLNCTELEFFNTKQRDKHFVNTILNI